MHIFKKSKIFLNLKIIIRYLAKYKKSDKLLLKIVQI